MPSLTTATISMELLQDCHGTLEQLTTGITNLGVAANTITRLARNDDKAAAALSLDLASKIVTVLDCGIEDLLEAVDA
jgi:hypothetical protein